MNDEQAFLERALTRLDSACLQVVGAKMMIADAKQRKEAQYEDLELLHGRVEAVTEEMHAVYRQLAKLLGKSRVTVPTR